MSLPRVLIIDDEERIRELLREYLSDVDEFHLRTAESGEEALALLSQRPESASR